MCEVIVEGNTREGEKRIIAWVNGHLWTFQRQPPEGYIIGRREFLFLLTSTRRLYRASVKLSLNTLEGLIVIIQRPYILRFLTTARVALRYPEKSNEDWLTVLIHAMLLIQ